ncbi:hypothetical protein CFE53_00460 [Methanofervidicoccus sp. A16]|uniref:hypothetical protein n=1 Tax=Methanofervidicoccus sp. A16 TaxID=2607662 RepID=UPI0011883BD1|nr:hypothetical protein [Methanofervidicoccus sp. A16]AXI24720.1 hypothetical protein CFE53_00460 [Methanofervidicoccus sp. A16]
MGYIRDEMVKPILIGGVIGGVLSSVPVIACLNCCCCLLYVLSGVITAYLMSKEFDPSDRDYLISGALSGGVAGFVNCVLDTLITFITYGVMAPFMANYYTSEYMNMMMGGPTSLMIFTILSIPLYIILGAIFGAVGGMLYGKLMK